MIGRLYRGSRRYTRRIGQFNRNVRLSFLASAMSGIAQGIFAVTFNLYILSLGIGENVLGAILSAAPFAQAIGSIPASIAGEIIGYKNAFAVIFGATGLGQLAQAATPVAPLIFVAAFMGGLGYAGDFVVRLPFLAANTSPPERAHVFSISSMIFSVALALGGLFAAYAPHLLRSVAPDLTTAYRYTLYVAGSLTLASVIPSLLLHHQVDHARERNTLSIYLWGMDRFTFQQAVVSLFVGLSIGAVLPFANLYFINHLGSSREFFGIISALAIVPAVVTTALGPVLAARLGSVRAVTVLRLVIPAALVVMAITTNPLLGAVAFWAFRSLFMMAQPLSFAFAMEAAKPRAKAAASAWLNVTFWLGNAVAAPVTGIFLARSNYAAPLLLSAVAVGLAAACNHFFFGPLQGRGATPEPAVHKLR